jgi:flavin-dependent dehydrogenase
MTCVVSRVLFDRYLAERAEKAGAQCCLTSRAESLAVGNGSVRGVIVKRDSGTEVLSTRVVVDAEGVSSNIVREAGLAAVDRHGTVNGVEAEVEGVQGVEPDMVEVFAGRKYAPGLYAWLIPRRDGTAKVGLATRSGNPWDMLQRFMHNHPSACEKLGKARIRRMAFHPVPLGGPIPKVFAGGFLAVGDAASHVKPTTGGGVILGLTCARAAAEVVSGALLRGDFSADSLSGYQRRCDEIMGFDMLVMLWMRRMLDALSDEKLGSAIGFCARFGLDKAFQDFGDVDFQGRSLLRLLRNPKVVPALAYFLFLYLSANP